jgi:hypothetical protein
VLRAGKRRGSGAGGAGDGAAFYSTERGGEEARLRRWRELAGRPLMAAAARLGASRYGRGKGRAAVGERAGRWSGALMAKADGRGAGKAAPECGCRRPAR